MGYTCNGSTKGCERDRFGHCDWHDNRLFTYSVTFELEGSVCNRVGQHGGMAQSIQDILDDYEHADILSVVKC